MTGKACSKCKEIKPFKAFYTHRSRKSAADGYHSQCKKCMNDAARVRHAAKRRNADRKAIVHRQKLFVVQRNGGYRSENKAQRHIASLPLKHWYRIENPMLREEARLEYERLLQPPPLLSRNGDRLDV